MQKNPIASCHVSLTCLALILPLLATSQGVMAEDAQDLAKAVQNPVANMISLPFAFDFDHGSGPHKNGRATVLNIQPVIPFKLTQDWNVIVRTIVPLVHQHTPGLGSASGNGDILQSFFFSPANVGSVIWGVGPVVSYPTASERALGSGKFGLGPTGVMLVQNGPWTVGALANHVWSVAGDSKRSDVSTTYLQPFVAYSLGDGWTVGANTKIIHDWSNNRTSVAILGGPSKVFTLGNQPMSFGVQGRYYALSPSGGPRWGISASLTFLFPRK